MNFVVKDPTGTRHIISKIETGPAINTFEGTEAMANWNPHVHKRPFIVMQVLNELRAHEDFGETKDGYAWLRL